MESALQIKPENPPIESGRRQNATRVLRTHLGAFAAHIVLSIFFTWPLVLNLFPGSPARTPGIIVVDRDQNLWNLWWVRHALMHGQNPFVTDVIWYPTPVSLYYHTLNIFNGLVAVPLLSVFSLTTTYNLIVLFSFVLAGYGAFLLVRDLSGNVWAGMIGSIVFAYSAYHIATMRGLLQLISLEWVPFYILFLLKALHGDKWMKRSDFGRWLMTAALPAGFFLFLIALIDWYYTMYMLILTGLLVLRAVAVATRVNAFRLKTVLDVFARATIPALIFLVLVAPILIPTIGELRTSSYMLPSSDEPVRYSADLLTFFQPPQDQRLWGYLFQNRQEWPFGTNRYEVYFTYTALFLTGVCLFATRNRLPGVATTQPSKSRAGGPTKWFWAGSAFLFFLLALGPVLQVNGQQVRGLFGSPISLPMPYQLIEKVPLLNISRSPDRFDMPLTLCLAVLAGYGTNVLLRIWWRHWPLAWRGSMLVLVFTGLIALELFPAPYPQRSADVPDWYTQRVGEAGDYSILELPPQDDYWHGAYRMYFQTAHEKRIFGGYISREYNHPFIERTPAFQELLYADGAGDMFDSDPETWNSALAYYKVRYIVLQKARLPDRVEPAVDVSRWREAIKQVGGGRFELVHSDEFLEAYRVPDFPEQVPFLSVGEGWGEREVGPNGSFRWMSEQAELVAHAPMQTNILLSFRIAGLGDERTVQIYQGERQVYTGKVGALQELRVGPINLPTGQSSLRFVSPEGTVSPEELGMAADPRQLSFAVLNARLEVIENPGESSGSAVHLLLQRGR